MAWNPDPEVAALRDYAKKFDRPVVVAFSIHRDGDRFQMVTYGETKGFCTLAASFGDEISKAVASGEIAAPEIEPNADPHGATLWRRMRGDNHRESWSAWMVERSHPAGGTQYLTMNENGSEWTDDPLAGLHFVRREDAERFAAGREDAEKIAEHEFVDPPWKGQGPAHMGSRAPETNP